MDEFGALRQDVFPRHMAIIGRIDDRGVLLLAVEPMLGEQVDTLQVPIWEELVILL